LSPEAALLATLKPSIEEALACANLYVEERRYDRAANVYRRVELTLEALPPCPERDTLQSLLRLYMTKLGWLLSGKAG